MNKLKHLSIQIHGGVSITPYGVILSALAECEGEDMNLCQKAIHIDNALAIFIRKGYKVNYCSDEDALLVFEHPSEKK